MTADSATETSRRFEAHVGPVRDALVELLGASDKLQDQWGSLPNANSQAMAEVAAEEKYVGTGPWGDEPVRQAHNLASLLLLGADDCVNSTCRLLASEPTPIYSHIVLARATLEHAGRAWWLLDPEIGIQRRIARGVNDRIHGLSQQSSLPLELSEKRRAVDRRAELFAEASRLGFRKVGDKKSGPCLEEKRPTSTSLIRQLLADRQDEQLGRAVYAFYSAVAHGTTYGLSQSVEVDAPGAPATPGIRWGAVYTGSRDVCSVLTALILGLGRAHGARNTLFGWASDGWNEAYLNSVHQAKRALGL